MIRVLLTRVLPAWSRVLARRIGQGVLIALVVLTIIGAMIWWNDPLRIAPGGILGIVAENGNTFRLIVSGDIYRLCAGIWSVDIEREDGQIVTARGDISTRLLPVGNLSNHTTPPLFLPRGVKPLDQTTSYPAIATFVYQCGLMAPGNEPFYRRIKVPGIYHHEFTFTISPPVMPPSSEDEMSQQQSRRAKV